MKERDVSLDLMRTIGILVIMIAHSNPPGWLFQLRNFGTPLLIVASALTYATIYKNKSINIKTFLIKRLKRLILPAWIFLAFFYPFLYLVTEIFNTHFPFTLKSIALSFVLYSGFVWIFKVYVILAFVTPFAIYFKKRMTDGYLYFMILILVYIAYEVIVYIVMPEIPSGMAKFANTVVLIIIPYTVLFLYGFKMADLSKRNIFLVSVFSLILFCSLSFYYFKQEGSFVQTQKFKFPPRVYYLSYAFLATHIIYFFCYRFSNYLNSKFIIWLSSKSLWIYLWHILAYYIWYMIAGIYEEDLWLSVLGALFLLGFSISATLIQTSVVNRLLGNSNNPLVKQLITLLT